MDFSAAKEHTRTAVHQPQNNPADLLNIYAEVPRSQIPADAGAPPSGFPLAVL
jgi:hypothetical protein